jgi:siroheme synthase-like protein
MRYYPVYLDLKERLALVVGGGVVAEGKIMQLVEADAEVRVVSPSLTPSLASLVDQGVIAWRDGFFQEADLDAARVVISATDDPATNEEVARAAAARGILCNVVDQPELCDFIAPAVIARGRLQISISTGGGSPALAQRVRREIEALIGEEYGELLELASELRREARLRLPDFASRRDLHQAFIASPALELARAGRPEEARAVGRALLNAASPVP